MNDRDLFKEVIRGESVSKPFLPFNFNYEWFMDETLERWRNEGLSGEVDLADYWGLNKVGFVDSKPYGLVPAFTEELIFEDETIRIFKDECGITQKVFRDHEKSKMPQWLDFPIKSPEDFEEFKKRLDPTTPSRYPNGSLDAIEKLRQRDHPLGIVAGSYYGHTLQMWVGTENLCMLFYDNPAFVHEMLEHLEYFFYEMIKRLIRDIEFDFASFGEDIAYKGRSFISPGIFKEFIQPHYVSICNLLQENSIKAIFVDSDGFIDELIPLWMEVGINGFSPLEAAAGMNAVSLKKKYGKDIILAGNIDKRALIRGENEIDKEIDKVKMLLDMGGYLPAVDHSVPPDVPLANFEYFIERIKAL